MKVDSWLWALSVVGGLFILVGMAKDGPTVGDPADWIIGGMGLGMGVPLLISQAVRVFRPTRKQEKQP